jgi:hypothetical protein
MSQENVEIIQKGNAAFRRGDWDAMAKNLDGVVHEILWSVQGAGSGVSSQVTVIAAARVERERIAEILYFWEWRDALNAVGLAE